MSYLQISHSLPMSRRQRGCDWCREVIEKGWVYTKEVGVFEGDFQSSAMHLECAAAASLFFKSEDGESGYEPHSHKRGSCEES